MNLRLVDKDDKTLSESYLYNNSDRLYKITWDNLLSVSDDIVDIVDRLKKSIMFKILLWH